MVDPGFIALGGLKFWFRKVLLPHTQTKEARMVQFAKSKTKKGLFYVGYFLIRGLSVLIYWVRLWFRGSE